MHPDPIIKTGSYYHEDMLWCCVPLCSAASSCAVAAHSTCTALDCACFPTAGSLWFVQLSNVMLAVEVLGCQLPCHVHRSCCLFKMGQTFSFEFCCLLAPASTWGRIAIAALALHAVFLPNLHKHAERASAPYALSLSILSSVAR